MLHDPARHAPLRPDAPPWRPDLARAEIATIVDDLLRQRGPDGRWTLHPRDDEGDTPAGGFQNLYLGDAGVVWALHWLQRRGLAAMPFDPAAALADAHARFLADPGPSGPVPSLLMGEAGLLLARWAVDHDAATADRLHEVVRANIANPTNEMLWAAPGTMLAAWHLARATGEARWSALFADNVEQLWRTWQPDAASGLFLWTQDMYGKVARYYGAGHGQAGNLHPLLKGADGLDDDRREALWARAEALVGALALHDGDAANWPPGDWTPRPGTPRCLMQWCHGAPGFVTALVDFPVGRSAAMEALLRAAGEAVWRAGPLAKGAGVCHGTAGNAQAFLVLHRRTGEAMWLDRARAFAMHAVGQVAAQREATGRGWPSLWTGDAGVALTLAQCLDGTPAGLPLLDFID